MKLNTNGQYTLLLEKSTIKPDIKKPLHDTRHYTDWCTVCEFIDRRKKDDERERD